MMILALSAAFIVGLICGKGLHLFAEEQCEYVRVMQAGYGSTRHVRCSLHGSHRGPHKMKVLEGIDTFRTTHWIEEGDK